MLRVIRFQSQSSSPQPIIRSIRVMKDPFYTCQRPMSLDFKHTPSRCSFIFSGILCSCFPSEARNIPLVSVKQALFDMSITLKLRVHLEPWHISFPLHSSNSSSFADARSGLGATNCHDQSMHNTGELILFLSKIQLRIIDRWHTTSLIKQLIVVWNVS